MGSFSHKQKKTGLFLFFFVVIVIFSGDARAYEEVPPGPIPICAATWGPGTVYVTGNVTVIDSCTLAVLPHTIVKFAPGAQLTVNGTLSAIGTIPDDIIFTSMDDNIYGDPVDGSDGVPNPGDWDGIFLNGSSTNDGIGNFDFCRVRYGGKISATVDANVYFYLSDSGYFRNSVCEFSEFYGLRVYSSSSEIADSTVANNGSHGLYAYGSGEVTVRDNIFNDNTGFLLYLAQSFLSPNCSNNSGSGNGLDGVVVRGQVASNQTWNFGSDVPMVVDNSMSVSDGVTLTIPAGTVVKMSPSVAFTVNGTLDAVGTASDWIVFTSLYDDVYGGDTNADGSATSPSPGDWEGIFLNGSSTNDGIGNFDFCRVRYGGDISATVDANVYFYLSDSGYFRNSVCEFSEFYGLRVYSSSSEIADSTVANNGSHGLYAYGSGEVTVRDNIFNDNTGFLLYLAQSFLSPNCSNNSGSGNGLDGVVVRGQVASNQTWNFGSDVPMVVDNSMSVSDDVTLTIPAGTVVKMSPGVAFTVNGTLDAVGTASDWIVFTSLYDDVYGGDTNADGSATSPFRGDWEGIFLNGSSTNDGIGNFDFCRVRYGGDISATVDANVYFYLSGFRVFQKLCQRVQRVLWPSGVFLVPGGHQQHGGQ